MKIPSVNSLKTLDKTELGLLKKRIEEAEKSNIDILAKPEIAELKPLLISLKDGKTLKYHKGVVLDFTFYISNYDIYQCKKNPTIETSVELSDEFYEALSDDKTFCPAYIEVEIDRHKTEYNLFMEKVKDLSKKYKISQKRIVELIDRI